MSDLKTLATPRFMPCTQRMPITSDWLLAVVAIDFEPKSPELIYADNKHEQANEGDLEVVRKWLQDNPWRPEELTPNEILALLTDDEEDRIDRFARRLARELFSAITPVTYERFAAGMREIQAGGLLTEERLQQILNCVPVEN